MLGHLVTVKVTAIAAGTVLSMGGVAAAATGNLPDPAQDAVSDVAAHVGVDVPKATPTTVGVHHPQASERTTTTTAAATSTSTTGVDRHEGTEAEDHAKDGVAHELGEEHRSANPATSDDHATEGSHSGSGKSGSGKSGDGKSGDDKSGKSGDDKSGKSGSGKSEGGSSSTSTSSTMPKASGGGEHTSTTLHHESGSHDGTTTSTTSASGTSGHHDD